MLSGARSYPVQTQNNITLPNVPYIIIIIIIVPISYNIVHGVVGR